MRIGICCFPSFGGSGVVASELALALAEGGDSVHVSNFRPVKRVADVVAAFAVVRRQLPAHLCPVGDVEALARSCVALLTDPSRREAFGRHARHWARSHFDRGAIVARYREVYRATLTPGGASAPRPGEALEGNVDA